MSDFVDSIMDHLNGAMARAVEAATSDLRQSVQAEVSIPVEYATGPRGGLLIIRSQPGEAPRKERGVYQKSWEQSVTPVTDAVQGEVYTDDVRAAYFTKGTSRMRPRPHAEASFNRIAPTLPERLTQQLNNG
jgi:hypothetical protein